MVVVPLKELPAAGGAHRRRLLHRQEVKYSPAGTAGPPVGETPHKHLIVNGKQQHGIKSLALPLEELFKELRLRHRPGEAVQKEAPRNIRLRQARGDHLHDHLVRDQSPLVHVLFCLHPKGGLIFQVLPEDIPR